MGGKRCPAERKVEAVQQGVYRGHSVSSVVTPLNITLSRERSGLMRVYPGLPLKKQSAPTNKTTRFCFCLFHRGKQVCRGEYSRSGRKPSEREALGINRPARRIFTQQCQNKEEPPPSDQRQAFYSA